MKRVTVVSFEDVHVGDVVCGLPGDGDFLRALIVEDRRVIDTGIGSVHKELRVRSLKYPDTHVAWIAMYPKDFLILLHRPELEGRTEEDLLMAVETAAHRFVAARHDARAVASSTPGAMHDHLENPKDVLVELREAMDAHSLGKPPKC